MEDRTFVLRKYEEKMNFSGIRGLPDPTKSWYKYAPDKDDQRRWR
jgi:hypothetical protein